MEEKKKATPFLAPLLPKMRAWTSGEAANKEEDLREMFKSYGEYADIWLKQKTGDPTLVIWDFTEREMKAIVKWCMKRGQSSPVVAWSLDRALDGRTDIDFAVIMGGKTLETGWRLGVLKQRKVRVQA